MPRFFAFLRAINVGGRTVKMADLARHLEKAGHEGVETFIASGNVVLESTRSPAALEKQLEADLEKALGFRVDVFVRTSEELQELAATHPFGEKAEGQVHIGFLKEAPGADFKRELAGLAGPADELEARGREVFWHCKTRSRDSAFSGAVLEKLAGGPATMRNRNTIDRMAKKWG